MQYIFEKTLQIVHQTYPETRRSDTQHMGNQYSEKWVLISNEIEAYLGSHEIKKTFHVTFWYTEDNYDFVKNMMDSLKTVINELNWEGIVFPVSAAKYYSPRQLLAYGDKAENVRHLLEGLLMHYDVRCYRGHVDKIYDYSKYVVEWDIEDECIVLKSDGKENETLSTSSAVEFFVTKQRETADEIRKSEQAIITYTQNFDPTSYYHRTSSGDSFLYIFGVQVPFQIMQMGTMYEPKFKLRFENDEIEESRLKEIEKRAQEKIKTYINKHRLKAITSSNYDIIERHLAFMFGHRISKRQFVKGVISDVSSDEILGVIREAEPEEVIAASDDKKEVFHNSLKKYKLLFSFQIKNLLIFITTSRYFVFKENED